MAHMGTVGGEGGGGMQGTFVEVRHLEVRGPIPKRKIVLTIVLKIVLRFPTLGNLWKMVHALWFIRNTVKFSICLFPIFSKNGYMIVAYLLLNFLVNLSMVFLSNSSHSGCIRTSQEVCGT